MEEARARICIEWKLGIGYISPAQRGLEYYAATEKRATRVNLIYCN
jgi:hypothetical protein